MKALSQRRRHPFAGVALLLLGLLITGGLYAAATTINEAQASNNEDAYSSADVDEGERLFVANCATCHGINAEGTDAGPSLVGVGAASVDFQVGTGRMPMQMQGPQAQQKPKQFNDEQTMQLAAYVASLGAGPAVPEDQYLDVDEGDPARGGELFRINCAMCHNAAAAGGALTEGKFAPSLHGVDERHIYEAMTTGPQNMPVFNDANIPPEDKRDIVSFLKTYEAQGSPGGFSLGSLGPVSEGLFIWTGGIAVIIGSMVWLTSRSS
ncbi:cytochrome bc1 complex diheme cytochrome c subunit [Nesterenkonia aerolata]|uniref:Cytochrome bc1 complex cytochrome c subunit n=1 Tax=Nesterenkonia aerolata TaxID=3074079 RepID=A0ABU2DQ87_9MICC|nr:c-type cytochrome [Nesterenkonia sp. LY-0111]MDR8018667.1 c-type cytochrome [Nesterenkonia sp. LY-0111]